jgi:putative thioredoxin
VEAAKPPTPHALIDKVVAEPGNLSARLELAEYYIGYKEWPLAMAELLEIVLRDRAFQDDVGRRRMIEVFDLASSQPQVVSEWRRRLGASLNVR